MKKIASESSEKRNSGVKQQTKHIGSRTTKESAMNKEDFPVLPLEEQEEMQRRAVKYWEIWEQIVREKREIIDVAHVSTHNPKPVAIRLVNAEWWYDNCWKDIYPEFGRVAHQRVKDMLADELLGGRFFQVGIKWEGEEQTENIWIVLFAEHRDANGERCFDGALRNNSVFVKQAKWGSAIGPIYARNIKDIESDQRYSVRARS